MFFSCVMSSQDTIKIASWNTFLLPRLAKKSNQKERAKMIGSYLLQQDYDVICLQEVFHKKALKIIKDSLKEKYPVFVEANKSGLFKTSSGLITLLNSKTISLSKCERKEFKKFKKHRGIDRYAKKGVQQVKYRNVITIFNTHMQSTEKPKAKKVRGAQLDVIKDFMSESCYGNNIIVGDLNIVKNSPEYDTLINKLNVIDVDAISQKKVTCNAVSNELNSNNENKNKEVILDYILIDKDEPDMKLKNLKYKEVRVNNEVLSDHNLVEAQIIITK